ncbi:HNH endonuclease signature motif containing protein [Limnobaculum xujianqingii]|uniref:HNH endonuclease signature motif containing protein n=1 Tax=Limnobaculum xujianqingii TaxID=2738837 RepID=UPI0015B86FF3|nr:HNH endonuclease signature motif containing protein [Limnobaculum xujianqingii]
MTQNDAKKLFVYEQLTGMLRRMGGRKPYPWHGTGKDRRYLATSIGTKTYYLHQLVWLYHHGYIPKMIDHINRNPRDCRIENLRPCTNAQNQYNIAKRGHNTSGFKGVVFHPRCSRKPWQAKIVVRGKVKSLGYYPTKEQAAEAYAKGASFYAKEFASF